MVRSNQQSYLIYIRIEIYPCVGRVMVPRCPEKNTVHSITDRFYHVGSILHAFGIAFLLLASHFTGGKIAPPYKCKLEQTLSDVKSNYCLM